LQGGKLQNRKPQDRKPLSGTRSRDVANYLAERFFDRLGLDCCTVYLYDEWRLNLTEIAHRGGKNDSKSAVSLEPGSSLAVFEQGFGKPGGCFTLALWDGHRLLGVIYCRLPKDRVLGEDTLGPARWMVMGAGVALSQALIAEGYPPLTNGTAFPRVTPYPPYVLNRYLAGHLRGALRRSGGLSPVILAIIRLSGPVRRGVLPARGVPLPGAAHERGGPCRGFGFGLGSNRIGLVWQGTTREQAREVLIPVARGEAPLGRITGPARARKLSATRVSAAALTVCPDDARDGVRLLAGVLDLLEAHSYLLASKPEGRDHLALLATDTAMAIMDSRVLDAQIVQLRQELKEAIASGLSFDDAPVRDISERLDRLIVVMQRLMGHRGAVP
jgi:hypothetical protein